MIAIIGGPARPCELPEDRPEKQSLQGSAGRRVQTRCTGKFSSAQTGSMTRFPAGMRGLVRYGVDLVDAMQAGRWKTSAMVARYSVRLLAKRGGMAQIADRRVQF
jgi:hypothetical protein